MKTSVAVLALLSTPLAAAAAEARPGIRSAFDRLYNFDFPGAHRVLDAHIRAHPEDPMGFATRACALLFFELDRLGILESEFFANDERIADKRKLKPDPAIKGRINEAIGETRRSANALLERDAHHTDALFSLTIADGVITDYTALVERRQIASLSTVKSSAAYAHRLLQIDPHYYDAYLSTGLTEYLIGSLPFFVRWFVRVDHVKGDKQAGIDKLALTARHGRYLRPFAKILLAIAHLREKRPTRARELLEELARDFPQNPLFRKELAKVTEKLRNGELRDTL